MKTHQYEYNTTIPRTSQQNQVYAGRYVNTPTGQMQPPVLQHQRPQPGSGNQKPRPPERMPKARVLALAHTLKRWLVVASIVSFGTFGGLVALHQVTSTTTTSSSTSTNSTSSSSSQNSNSFLNQQGGNISGTSSPSSTAVSGTQTS